MAQDFNAVYPNLVLDMGEADADLPALAWAVQALDDTAVFDRDDVFLSALSADLLGDPLTLTGIAWAVDAQGVGLACSLDDEADDTLDGLLANDSVGALIVFIDTGSDATSRLAGWIGLRQDTSPIAGISEGDPAPLWWPPDGVFLRFPC